MVFGWCYDFSGFPGCLKMFKEFDVDILMGHQKCTIWG